MNSYEQLMAALEACCESDSPENVLDVLLAYRAHREAEGIWLEAVPDPYSYTPRVLLPRQVIMYEEECYRVPEVENE